MAALAALAALAFVGLRPSRVEAAEGKQTRMNLAFVLLSDAKLPKGEAVERAFRGYAVKGQSLRYLPDSRDKATRGKYPVAAFETPGGRALVGLIPAPVPKGEAEEAVRYSVSALDRKWKLPPHKAHLVVTLHAQGDALTRISLLTSILAAIAESSSAVGIYWGDAGATHDPKFFRDIAKERTTMVRLALWTGISIAREGQRYSFLSLGMKQFDLSDLLLVVPLAKSKDGIPFMFDLLGMAVEGGKPLPEGDTVGRTATEKLPVHYVPSPVDPKVKVWRVELK
jgi:hypothetical protein